LFEAANSTVFEYDATADGKLPAQHHWRRLGVNAVFERGSELGRGLKK
jgi:hypothetical protein